MASSYLPATALDFARFGLLSLRGGVGDGQQVVERSWVDTARRARNHIRSLERLGYHVQADPVDPVTGEVLTPAAV